MDRYNSISSFLKNKFGCKVYKVSLSSGLTCPNRDGTKGISGCIFCNPDSNLPFKGSGPSIKEQLKNGTEYVKGRHKGSSKFISYFQHFSNTYGEPEELKKMYEDAISFKDVVALAISTRPDCLNDGVWKILDGINKKIFLWLELGLQSSHDRTLELIGRGHMAKDFEDAVKKAHSLRIMTCAHIIFGLPKESRDDMLETVRYLADLKIGGVKIHNLHILKGTKLAQMYEKNEVTPLTLEEYSKLVVDALELLPKDTLIHRFNGHSPRSLTIAPSWSINKLAIMNAVHDELERRDTFQGRLYAQS